MDGLPVPHGNHNSLYMGRWDKRLVTSLRCASRLVADVLPIHKYIYIVGDMSVYLLRI